MGRTLFAIAFLGLGIEHFVFQEFITGRAPHWPAALPGKAIAAYASGAAIIAMAIAIAAGKKARAAATLVGVLILL